MAKKKKEREPDRILLPGKPDFEQCDNKVVSARYTLVSFFPVAIGEQFRRFANVYFLIMGCIMAVGYYRPDLFESAISPWTTLGPLAVVISFSLLVEGNADYKRHINDRDTNNADCVILRRADEIDAEENAQREEKVLGGRDVSVNINKAFYETTSGERGHYENQQSGVEAGAVKVGFQKVRRMDIRQGHFVLIKNREMVPADIVLLASSNDGGSSYIETSSIDGETNLKLRRSPQLPKKVLDNLRASVSKMEPITEDVKEDDGTKPANFESIQEATKRLTRFSYLGRPEGKSTLDHPEYELEEIPEDASGGAPGSPGGRASRFSKRLGGAFVDSIRRQSEVNSPAVRATRKANHDGRYIAALTTEPPNPSVHTFQGKLTLPPFNVGESCQDIALGAENILLRGAVLRNTEWVIGVACFTGRDTKLIQNSFDTPSKFSQLDMLMNRIVLCILCLMILIIVVLSSLAVRANDESFDDLWYAGFNKNTSEPWPYLPPDFEIPAWQPSSNTWIQFFFMYITLLNNFVPLSLYVTVEVVTFFMLYLIYFDLNMYDNTTNTRAVARSTNVTDLGQIQYIFSDKTGTLTQNVMRFKRCSVDGMAFGAPIQKTRPGQEEVSNEDQRSFLPLRQLLVGQFHSSRDGLEGLGGESSASTGNTSDKLTFNAEMFIRVMCLCHTVVVEKDLDKKEIISSGTSVVSQTAKRRLFGRKKSDDSNQSHGKDSLHSPQASAPLSVVSEEEGFSVSTTAGKWRDSRGDSRHSGTSSKSPDGAPDGYAFQAESPDEGALVSAASKVYGFQVVSRDSNGIKLRVSKPSHFEDKAVAEGLRQGSLSLNKLAAQTASQSDDYTSAASGYQRPAFENEPKEETWTVLAVNKFDSDRKRMSILLRSPPELGSLPVLFCKGADSAMLQSGVTTSSQLLNPVGELPSDIPKPASISDREREVSALTTVDESQKENDQEGWELAQMLGIQSHLGDFASEGLRTLVLGLRVLTEAQCDQWLTQHKNASVSLTNREALLTEAAMDVERNLHIAGATAIEDKLQIGVPATIATLEKAGIKLWVLTGDKRETAVEIGYSTHVLTPKMHVSEVGDLGKHLVRTQMSMEFVRLVKKGKLPQYQKVSIDGGGLRSRKQMYTDVMFSIGKFMRTLKRSLLALWASLLRLVGAKERAEHLLETLTEMRAAEANVLQDIERRGNVRARADKMIQLWLESDEGKAQRRKPTTDLDQNDDDLSLASEETPQVFNRASSARSLLNSMRQSGQLSQADLRKVSIAHLTAQQAGGRGDDVPLVDEDTLSLASFFPGNKDDLNGDFDRKKRTLLERMFAIDRQVRKGHLKKHMFKERLEALSEDGPTSQGGFAPQSGDGPRALVIEGAALKHLLGDPELEEILFAVASSCEAVIACRVSPKQKALLVNLVRHNVKPTPVTLAIGDGANDVGMIQEAHVGVGISGKEGKQAVNASDFAIAQFRFLEDLVLIHGRWDFFRMSTVVQFSFYKNAVLAGILVIYTSRTVFSGTPLFDEWLIAMLNFVATIPVIGTGWFDRCLGKEYVRAHPEVYKSSRDNELITARTLARWIIMVFVHLLTLYFLTVPAQAYGGGMSPAWQGLMGNESTSVPGNGEGGDLKSVGTVTFTSMIFLFAYKVLYESRSLVHGRWPAFTCRKDAEEGFFSRLAWTWVSVTWLSVGFYLFAIAVYQCFGRLAVSSLSPFVDMANHVLGTRSMSWMLICFIPIAAITFDVCGKVFSNLFYPTQTQIHLEKSALARSDRQKRRFEVLGMRRKRAPVVQGQDEAQNAEDTRPDGIGVDTQFVEM